MKKIILILPVIALLFLKCQKSETPEVLPPDPVDTTVVLTPFEIITPTHFPQMIIPDDNQPYMERVMLGRMLYYDPILSNDGSA